jgi:hemerythrin-like domain-containing protein
LRSRKDRTGPAAYALRLEVSMQILVELRRDHDRLRAEMIALTIAASTRERLARFAADLKAHARREDEQVFVPLEKFLPRDHGPLAVMRAEHEEIEARLARLEGADPAQPEVRAEFAGLARVARDHFRKEEEVLFAFAERLLDAPAGEPATVPAA